MSDATWDQLTLRIHALYRAGRYDEAREAGARLDELGASWQEVEPTRNVRRVARRLLRAHRMLAVDALQLGAAIVAAGVRAVLPFLALDERLNDAAQREGFVLVSVVE